MDSPDRDVDTDAAALDRLRDAGIGGALLVADIESFQREGDPFDHVLVLRSFNHLHDLAHAFEVMTGLLREGGELLICDAPSFAT